MSIQDLKQTIARQLNDHRESPSGVEQDTYYEWTSNHITEALCAALSRLYSIIPQHFSELKELKIKQSDCLISFCEDCDKFLDIAAVIIDGEETSCSKVSEITGEVNSLTGLLGTVCIDDEEVSKSNYEFETLNGSNCTVKFTEPVPVGAVIKYFCGKPPGESDLDDPSLIEYHSFLLNYSLWFILLTDNESRSNLNRVQLYREEVESFIQTKLLIEFSLREDDYLYGRAKTPD